MKDRQQPTDDEIKEYIKQILEGANLHRTTMKTVCKQVYSHFDLDLAHRKDFIKATVKSLISPPPGDNSAANANNIVE